MLPRINPQQRPELSHHCILIRISLDPNGSGLRVLDQPRPARALDPSERGVEFLLQGVEAAVAVVNGGAEGAGGWVPAAAGFRGQVFPEEGVVYYAACVCLVSTFVGSRMLLWSFSNGCASTHLRES